MTPDEFKAAELAIEKYKQNAISQLIIEYCKSNAQAEIGDIVSDNRSNEVFIVEKRIANSGFLGSMPKFEYTGTRLKKDLTPFSGNKTSFSFDGRITVIKKANLQ